MYDISIKYFNDANNGIVRLGWQHLCEPSAIIPAAQLYPAATIRMSPHQSNSEEKFREMSETGNTRF